MSLSEALTDIELINTFEDWRLETNKIIKVIMESSDDDVLNGIVTTDISGATYINVVNSNTITSNIATGVNLVYTGSGSRVNFKDADVISLGIAREIKVNGGQVVSGSNPDSYIQSVQIRDSEILLNGQALRSDGTSEIDFTEATITNLGEVQKLNVYPVVPIGGTGTAGTLHGVSLKINSTYTGTLTVQDGTHNFTGAVLLGPEIDSGDFHSGVIHSSDITVNTGSYFISNTSSMLATNDSANVAVGKFPEWAGIGSSRIPTSSSGRLHIRRDFSNPNTLKTTVDTRGDEFVIEGNTSVGMTLLANNAANSYLFFGDSTTPAQGYINHSNPSNYLTFGTNSADKMRIYSEFGGSVQIPGAGQFETISGKLHIHQSSTDLAHGIFVNSDRGEYSAVRVESNQTTANVLNITTASLTSGSMVNLRYEPSTISFTGSLLQIHDDNQTGDTRSLIKIEQSHPQATGVRLMDLYTQSGKGIYINQDSDNYTLSIDAENTTTNTVDILVDSLSSGTGLHLRSTADHTSNLVSFISNGTGTQGTTLYVKTSAIDLVDTVLVENDSSKIFQIESTGNVGININEQEVIVKTGFNTVGFAYANTALYTLHVGGTLGVEANSIFNGYETRVNANLVVQNANTTIAVFDATDSGYSIIGIGENATEFLDTTLYLSYPGGDRQGYSYIGMGEILFDPPTGSELQKYRPRRWAIEFNQYDNSLYFPGILTVANNVVVTKNLSVGRHITGGRTITIDGDASFADDSVLFIEEVNGNGSVYFKHTAEFASNTHIKKNLRAATANVDGEMTVTGNTVIGPDGTFHVDTQSFMIGESTFRSDVLMDEDLTITNDLIVDGNLITFTSKDSNFIVNGNFQYTGYNVFVEHTTSNTNIRGTVNLKGNTTIHAENVYISSTTSNTFTQGNITARGNVTLNGTNLDIASNTDIDGTLYNQGNVSLVSIDTDTRTDAIVKINRSTDPVQHGNTVILDKLTITGNTKIIENLVVNGEVSLSGSLDMPSGDLFANNIFVEYDATVKGNLNVSEGDILGSDDMRLKNLLTITEGYLTVANAQANSYFAGDLTVGNNVVIKKGTLTIQDGDIVGSDDLHLKGFLSANGKIGTNQEIESNTFIITTGNQTNTLGNGTIQITGPGPETDYTGNVYITGNTTITKSLRVFANSFFGEDVFIKGSVTAGDVIYEGISADSLNTPLVNAEVLQVSTTTTLADTFIGTTANPATIDMVGTINIDGEITIDGDIDLTGHALTADTVNVIDINVTGDITGVTGLDSQTLSISSVARVAALKVDTDVLINGVLHTGDTEIDENLKVLGQIECKGVDCRLPVYDSTGTLLNGLTLTIANPSIPTI